MGSNMDSKEFDLYKDIRCRTNGEIYIGVVGPVRTGKSTFIKHFMELCVIPKMDNEYAKKRAVDELPQSGKGKTIMTTEPKFIPQDAVTISLDDGSAVKVRLVDCVGGCSCRYKKGNRGAFDSGCACNHRWQHRRYKKTEL